MKLEANRYKTGEKALSHEEYSKLLAVITDIQDELMIRLGVNSGLRREDLCNVKCDNINLKDQTLRFYEAKKRIERNIDLSSDICALIQKFYNTLDKNDLRKREYLFDYVGRTAYRHFDTWCKAAMIPTRPIHALRGTCIKFAHDAGWSDMAIAKLTGDKIKTIQEHYMTPSIDEMRQLKRDKSFS